MNNKFKKIMSEERAISVIKKPMMTEKSTNLNQFNQYSFIVSNDSNSFEIKKAIVTLAEGNTIDTSLEIK